MGTDLTQFSLYSENHGKGSPVTKDDLALKIHYLEKQITDLREGNTKGNNEEASKNGKYYRAVSL